MSNYTSRIYGNALSALAAQQAVIATTANNIANVNTEGYSRRVAQLQNRMLGGAGAGFQVGSGVEVGAVTRMNDAFLQGVLHKATGQSYRYSTENEFLRRAEGLFAVDGSFNVVGEALSTFYASIDDLTLNPSSVELRAAVLQRGQDLVTSLQSTYSQLASLQEETDQRVADEVTAINSLTRQIADLNQAVASRENAGQVAADERDRRDVLLEQLAQRVSFQQVENNDGTVTLSLANGFTLVNGATARELSVTRTPSYDANPSVGLNNGSMYSIVYDYDTTGASPSHINLGSVIAGGEGSLAGLLHVRGYEGNNAETGPFVSEGVIPELAASIEAITRGLLRDFNNTYANSAGGGAYDLDGNAGGAAGTPIFFFGLNDINDQGAGGLDDDSDGIVADNYGDLLRETGAGGTIGSLTSLLQVNVTDPRQITASDVSGEAQNGEILQSLAALQNDDSQAAITVGNTANAYTYSGQSLNGIYNGAVSVIGNARSRAELNTSIAAENLVTIQSRRDEFSGVSLDEEFTKLLQFQKAFEANARVLNSANQLLDSVLQLL